MKKIGKLVIMGVLVLGLAYQGWQINDLKEELQILKESKTQAPEDTTLDPYLDVLHQAHSLEGFKRQVENQKTYSLVDLYTNLESLKIHNRILRDLVVREDLDISFVKEDVTHYMEGGNSYLQVFDLDEDKEKVLTLSPDLEVYIGSPYYIHPQPLDHLIHPGEPLEAGGLTLVVVEGQVKYIFTGRLIMEDE